MDQFEQVEEGRLGASQIVWEFSEEWEGWKSGRGEEGWRELRELTEQPDETRQNDQLGAPKC